MNNALLERFSSVRAQSEQYCETLEIEDFGLQAIPETSPAKWHLAHTTWFFETFILKAFHPNYAPQHPDYEVLFNSYYNGIGRQHPRAERGLLSRPTVAEVLDYRQNITDAMNELLLGGDPQVKTLTELGINHEQQHQELFFTDLKYNFSCNPLLPAYSSKGMGSSGQAEAIEWLKIKAGLYEIGYRGDNFCFDNELPSHPQHLQEFEIANRLVSNGEFLKFIEDGGYSNPELWLADGWAYATEKNWSAPLYWKRRGNDWFEFTLHGELPLDLDRPVSHVSAYEADAYCRWAGGRLPSEPEWEIAAAHYGGNMEQAQFIEGGLFHPADTSAGIMAGGLWQWTSSAYAPYPGFQAEKGAVGEYNGKFMANQLVLKGGSCVTHSDHYRHSYRNFFYPPDQWQFTGIRMARWP